MGDTDTRCGDPPAPIRLSMTLPGSASLGAFQAGGVAALAVVINALRQQGRDVHLDAIGGASAGSIVAMLFTHCLLTGRDAPALLREAWVDEVDVQLLRAGGRDSPLAFDDLREQLRSFLEDYDRHPCRVHEPLTSPVCLQVSLTSLLGLTTPVQIGSDRSELLTYADWLEFDLEPGGDHRDLLRSGPNSVLDAVLASASHPGAFPPKLVDRHGHDRHYRRLGVTDLPEDPMRWYTDGGLVESQPVQRVLQAAHRKAGPAGAAGATRLHLVVDPRSSGPSGDAAWADSTSGRTWIDGVRRALSILPTQALHDDLREVVDVNHRLARLDELVDRLGEGGDRDHLRRELEEVAGLAGKERIDVDLITPLLRARGRDAGVSELLAGDFIGAFGGFLDRSIRRNDFALGWACTEAWTGPGLAGHRVDEPTIERVLAELDRARVLSGPDADGHADGIEQLGRVGRWQLFLLAVQVGRVLASEALRSPSARVRELIGRGRS